MQSWFFVGRRCPRCVLPLSASFVICQDYCALEQIFSSGSHVVRANGWYSVVCRLVEWVAEWFVDVHEMFEGLVGGRGGEGLHCLPPTVSLLEPGASVGAAVLLFRVEPQVLSSEVPAEARWCPTAAWPLVLLPSCLS